MSSAAFEEFFKHYIGDKEAGIPFCRCTGKILQSRRGGDFIMPPEREPPGHNAEWWRHQPQPNTPKAERPRWSDR